MPQTLDEQPPSPSPSRNPFRVGFMPATPDALQSSPPLSPSPSPSTDPEGLASDSGDEWDDASSPESLDSTPSPASSRGSDAEAIKVDLFAEEDLVTAARGAVAVAGEKAHELFATTPGQVQVELYKSDEEDQVRIGDPLARIAGRHQGIGGKVHPDVQDLLSSMVGFFGYATKQLNRRTEARALDAGAAGLAGSPQTIPTAVDL